MRWFVGFICSQDDVPFSLLGQLEEWFCFCFPGGRIRNWREIKWVPHGHFRANPLKSGLLCLFRDNYPLRGLFLFFFFPGETNALHRHPLLAMEPPSGVARKEVPGDFGAGEEIPYVQSLYKKKRRARFTRSGTTSSR